MEKDPSPLDTLRQLKEWLDAGTITQQEFETLKQKLVFSNPTSTAPTAPIVPPAPPTELPVSLAPPVGALPLDFPVAAEPTTTIAPIEEPLLPPVTVEHVAAPNAAVPPAPPTTTSTLR